MKQINQLQNETFNKALAELSTIKTENKKIIDEFISKYSQDRSKKLEEIFSKVPQSIIDSIYATASNYQEDLVGGVYFIRNEYSGLIKIGCSKNIMGRFNQLKRSFIHVGMEPKLKLLCVVLTFPKYLEKLESQYHSMFKDKRKIGEWFDISHDDICGEILSCTDKFEIINDTLFDYTEYEYLFFEKVKQSYQIDITEALDKIGVKYYDYEIEWHLPLYFGDKNKLSRIVDIVENNQTGFYEKCYISGQLKEIGVKHVSTDKRLSFQQLKEDKFDRDYWQKITDQLNS